MNLDRRRFNQFLSVSLTGLAATSCSPGLFSLRSPQPDWLDADQIYAATRVPVFLERDFYVEDYGAKGDGQYDCSSAVAKAIEACHISGGGRVVFSSGVYRCGPVHLLSNVNLHIARDAEISFYTDPERYLPVVFTRWEGMELMGFSPLIYAYRQRNVAVTGSGLLNGNADDDTWWPWKGNHSERHWNYVPGEDQKPARDELFALAEAGVPVADRVFANGGYLRPPFIQFYECNEVLIEGVTIKNAPFWLIHPVLCEDVTVRQVNCQSHGPNSDGCDPESCNRVVIEECEFDTGDDCIAVKSGRNADGRRINKPCENILIQNCRMRAGHGGVVIGSEISGGVRNLHARNCEMSSPDLERALRIKTNAARGGIIEHIRYQNIQVGQVQDAIVVNYFYEEGPDGQFQPLVKDIAIQNLSVRQANRAFVLRGFPANPLSDISLDGVNIEMAGNLGVVENVADIQLSNVVINGRLIRKSDIVD